jgi:plastocyanin
MKRLRFANGSVVAVAAFAVLMTVGAACASTSSAGSGGSTTPAGGGFGGAYGGGSQGGGGSGSSGGQASVTVKQGSGGQLVFSPANLTVHQGDTIAIDDVASIPHTFTIAGQGIDVVNDGGQSQTVTIGLSPGTYTFVCRFHQSSGMKGTLTVTG